MSRRIGLGVVLIFTGAGLGGLWVFMGIRHRQSPPVLVESPPPASIHAPSAPAITLAHNTMPAFIPVPPRTDDRVPPRTVDELMNDLVEIRAKKTTMQKESAEQLDMLRKRLKMQDEQLEQQEAALVRLIRNRLKAQDERSKQLRVSETAKPAPVPIPPSAESPSEVALLELPPLP